MDCDQSEIQVAINVMCLLLKIFKIIITFSSTIFLLEFLSFSKFFSKFAHNTLPVITVMYLEFFGGTPEYEQGIWALLESFKWTWGGTSLERQRAKPPESPQFYHCKICEPISCHWSLLPPPENIRKL